MFTIISVLLALVVLFVVHAAIGRLGRLRKAERGAEASGDRELSQALRNAQRDIARGRFYSHYHR